MYILLMEHFSHWRKIPWKIPWRMKKMWQPDLVYFIIEQNEITLKFMTNNFLFIAALSEVQTNYVGFTLFNTQIFLIVSTFSLRT